MSLLSSTSVRTPLLSSVIASHRSHPIHFPFYSTSSSSPSPSLFTNRHPQPSASSSVSRLRHSLKSFLSTPFFHRSILLLIILDTLIVLSVLLLNLFICELSHPSSPPGGADDLPGSNDPKVIPRLKLALDILQESSFALSCIFLVELSFTLFAFGPRYLRRLIHAIDAGVITVGFVVDLVLKQGVIEEVAGLVVVLRLWRLIKIAEECVVEAYSESEEELTGMRKQIDDLQKEVRELRSS